MQELGYRNRRKGRNKTARRSTLIRRAMLAAASLLFVAAVWMLIDYVQQGRATKQTQQELRAEVDNMATPTIAPIEPTPDVQLAAVAALVQETAAPQVTPVPMPTPGAAMLPQFVNVRSKNTDMVGWLKADAFEAIDFPIVQRDNWFYVEHDFYRRQNIAGTVFLDEANSILPQDQNLILHGHNMKNGTMFGKLARLLERDNMASNPFFTFSTLYLSEVYVPYAVTITSIDPSNAQYFNFLMPQFAAEESADAYTGWLRQRSQLQLPVDVNADDRLLTLVTCHGNEDSERLIVALRALRPGEDQQQLARAFMEATSKNQ